MPEEFPGHPPTHNFEGVNPSDFRTPLPYEQAQQATNQAATKIEITDAQAVNAHSAPEIVSVEEHTPVSELGEIAVADDVSQAEGSVVVLEEATQPTNEGQLNVPRDEASPDPTAPTEGESPGDTGNQAEEVSSPAAEKTSDQEDDNGADTIEPPTELDEAGKGLFGKMSEKGQRIAKRLYEGLFRTPGAEKIIGRLQIAYNQHWIDKHQQKSAELKTKIDQLDVQVGALDMTKKEIEGVIEGMRQQNLPGVEALQMKLQEIDKRKISVQNEKDATQSKFEEVENKAKLYTTERDRIADEFIKTYDEKLKPMETELEKLRTARDEVDLVMAVTQAQHKELQTRLDDIEKQKTRTEEALRKAGMSEKEIRKFAATKELERVIVEGHAKIASEQEALVAQSKEINVKIAKADAKANPYRDKREEFIRVKQVRPVQIDVPPRNFAANPAYQEQTEAHTRMPEQQNQGELSGAGSAEESEAEASSGRELAGYMDRYNSLTREEFNDDAIVIDAHDFMAATRLGEAYQLDMDDFVNIVQKYLKLRKIPTEQFDNIKEKLIERK